MNQKKKFKIKQNEILELTFEELYDRFYDLIDRESKRIYKKYSRSFPLDEITQCLLIDLWRAYETYDVERGNIEDYITYRFGISRRDIKSKVSKIKKRNEKFTGLVDNITINETPEDNVITKNLIKHIYSYCDDDELELVNILIDKKEYTVIDYAKKYNLSRMTVYNRLSKLKDKIIKNLKKDDLIG